jgi:hypothetical protein
MAMASVTVRNSPYIIGPPISDPSRFFDRTSLFDFIRSNLLSGVRVMLLHGQRRIGKPSVLRRFPSLMAWRISYSPRSICNYVSNEPV